MRRDLQERFKREQEALSAFREDADRNAVRWVFSTEEIWSYDDLKLRHFNRGILAGPEGARYAFGYNRNNRPIVVRQFRCESVFVPPTAGDPASKARTDYIATRDVMVEEFIHYDDNRMDVSRFVANQLQRVCRIYVQDGWTHEKENYQDGYYWRARYLYESNRKKCVQSLAEDGRLIGETIYDQHGQGTDFRVRRDGTRVELGRPLPKGTTLKSLLEKIKRRLVKIIPERISNATLNEPIYCAVLAYDGEGNDVLPPTIGVGMESERSACVAQHGKRAWEYIWNPAEFRHFEKEYLQLDDDDLEEACDLANTELSNRPSHKPAIKMLVETARELQRMDWPEAIPKTADFVVYAVDFELGSLRKNLYAILPADKLTKLKAAKYL
jgi:hypothetical protein